MGELEFHARYSFLAGQGPCEPWSEWWITFFARRCQSAMLNASSTTYVCSVVAIDQPTIRRLKTSSTTAR